MRKITYYENILEFKESSKEQLTLNDLNNLELCRTCLVDTNADDFDLEKMCIMDVMQGSLLNVKEMLIRTTNIKMNTEEKLPSRVCKDCFNKITTLYYFTLQVNKADKVLKRLINKLDGKLSTIENDEDNGKFELTEESIILEVQELLNCTTQEIDNFEVLSSKHIGENDTISTSESDICGDIKTVSDNSEEVFQDEDDLASECYAEEIYLESESLDDSYIHKDDVEDTFPIDTFPTESIDDEEYIEEHLEDKLNENECQKLPKLRKRSIKGKKSLRTGSKHKQPRMTQPLLGSLKCEVCFEEFDRQQELIKHVRQLHPNSKAYKCRVCDGLFSHIQSLSRHMNTHKFMLVKNKCEYCSKSFVRVDDLRRHIRTHTGERPYACSLCEKAFKQQGEMKEHESTHFLPKIYECDQCPKTFTSRNGVYLHKKTHMRNLNDNHQNGGTKKDKKFKLLMENNNEE